MNWYLQSGKDSDVAISTRIRFARNLNGFKFNLKSKEDIEKFLAQDEILVEKISKKRGKEVLKTVDIKEDILDLKISNDKELLATISTGSAKNLKPEVLINSIYNFLNLPYDKYKILYKRMELFDGNKIKLDECK